MRLLVIVPDQISAILKKGEYQPLYYNPGELADEVHILMTNQDCPDKVALQRTVGKATLILHNLPETSVLPGRRLAFLTHWHLNRWAKRGVELIRRINPDMIRCHGADWNAFLASKVKETLGIPYCVSLHTNPDISFPRSCLNSDNPAKVRINAFYEKIAVFGLRNANMVVPVYKSILPYLYRLGIPEERIRVCYNVLNILHLKEKKDYRLHSPARLLYVGRLFEGKDPTQILRALVHIPDAEYTIIGDGPYRPGLEILACELGLKNRVHFEPAVDNNELCQRLPDYDIFAIHTDYFELNKSLLEALLTGLPSIVNFRRGDQVPEFQEGDFVWQVENTSEGYQKAIQYLLNNDFEREALGRRAFEHARALWNPRKTEAAYVEVYNQLLAKQSTFHSASQISLRCPRCHTPITLSQKIVCPGCTMKFPAHSGIPILVREPEEHERILAEARKTNPAWFAERQPAEDVSPWRHHLRKRRKYIEGALRRELAKRRQKLFPRLLDLGCGDGNNLAWLNLWTEELFASDYNVLRLLRAASQPATVYLADVMDYPAFDGVFDAIFFNHVIEHIPDDLSALREIHRILAPGGLLILGAPNEGAWWWQWAYRRNLRSRATTDHVHFYTAPMLQQRMEEAGFSVFEIKHLGWGPPDWGWDMKLRSYKIFDDFFEMLGRIISPEQSSSLYLLATK